jgi:hypothetical protein
LGSVNAIFSDLPLVIPAERDPLNPSWEMTDPVYSLRNPTTREPNEESGVTLELDQFSHEKKIRGATDVSIQMIMAKVVAQRKPTVLRIPIVRDQKRKVNPLQRFQDGFQR